MKFYTLYLFFLLCLTLSCDHKRTDVPYTGKLLYETAKITLNSGAIFSIQQARLDADPKGKVLVQLNLYNPSQNSVSIQAREWELETSTGLRSASIALTDSSIQIDPQASILYELIFEPINALKLFQLTGLKGDLCQSYKLTFKADIGVINFQLSDSIYDSYKKTRHDPIIFELQHQSDFETKQLAHLKKTPGTIQNGVHAQEQEILVSGLNTSFMAYVHNDTLIIKIKLVNHSEFLVSVIPDSVQIRIQQKWLTPVWTSETNPITIPRSQRALLELRYPISEKKIDLFSIDISTLSFLSPNPTPVFYEQTLTMKRLPL